MRLKSSENQIKCVSEIIAEKSQVYTNKKHWTLKISIKNSLRGQTALDRRTVLCLYVPGFQRQVFTRTERSWIIIDYIVII